ncbi:carboxypeptidase regulatory-like domain-containing protein [Candidatus Electrothrix sp.]|uniref:carboxypeptidase regulatory-like domain-containing protein n=1 Tax=Candidatus Electrothrix sp. TaxID=2170559 RepID=UPI004057A2C0
MNSLLNNFLLQDRIRTARSSLFWLIAGCCMVISNTSFAQYPDTPYDSNHPALPQYYADIEATERGGGTWGEILNMKVHVQGSGAIFTITSKKGPFYNTNSVSIRSGSHNGSVVVAGKIPSGSKAAKLSLDLNTVASFPHRFFATITNNVGYAWVGPVQIGITNPTGTGVTDETRASTPRENVAVSTGPQRPLISESPETAVENSTVQIAVTAGTTSGNDMVRVQCTASSSGNTPDNPYRSGWLYGGDTIQVPLVFHSAGTQAIFCNTLDSYGTTSSLSQRTISVASGQPVPTTGFPIASTPAREFSQPSHPVVPAVTSLPPAPTRRRIANTPAPRIEVPGQGKVNDPVTVKLVAGHDPQNRDLVRITCTADDSNKTTEDPYQSDWLPPEGQAEGHFTFYSPGEKNIYCTSYGRQGVNSSPTRETLNIDYANQQPDAPLISEYPDTTYPGRTTYITVTAGSDPDGDQVRVKCSATDSSMTENSPYISEWMAPQATATASFAFFTAGNKEITCITIDNNNAQSDATTRSIHVHSPNYTPHYAPDRNLKNRSIFSGNSSRAESCGCQQDNTSTSYPMQNTLQNRLQNRLQNSRQGGITFNQPYIPENQDQQSVFQRPEPQPDLKGRVVYRSNRTPVQNALVKILNAMSGRAYTATTDYNGEFKMDFAQGSFTGQIQATKGNRTSSIREVKIDVDNPTVIDLTIIDREQVQARSPSRRPVQQAPPAHNSVWQFN